MKITYDPKYDAIYLESVGEKEVDTVEVTCGVLIDSVDGAMVGIEIIIASI
jgi:uncharacterized protein YuzE